MLRVLWNKINNYYAGKLPTDLRWHLESPLPKTIRFGIFNLFSGWVFSLNGKRITGVEIIQKNKLLGTCDYGLEREDVFNAFPRHPQARRSGFLGWVAIPSKSTKPIKVNVIDKEAKILTVFKYKLSLKEKTVCFKNNLLRRKKKHFSSEAIPKKILIAGMAKSGTTALFFKIANSLASYEEAALKTKLLFEPLAYSFSENQRVLAKIIISVKSAMTLWGEDNNEMYSPVNYADFANFDKKIMLVRDPRDLLISSMLYSVRNISFYSNKKRIKEFIDILEKKETNPSEVSLIELIQARVGVEKFDLEKWLNHFKVIFDERLNFYRKPGDYLICKYENLVNNNIKEIESFLGFSLMGDSVVDKSFNRVVRTKDYGDWKNWFLEEDIRLFKPVFSDYMREFGYNDDWILPSRQVILPVHSSGYVKRILKEVTEL